MSQPGVKKQRSLERATFVSLLQTANALSQGVAELLRPSGLTPTQYHVLCVLNRTEEPLTCGEMGERLITRDPDVTRLLDRLEREGLISRSPRQAGRRGGVHEI